MVAHTATAATAPVARRGPRAVVVAGALVLGLAGALCALALPSSRRVYLFCTLATLAVAAAGLWLVLEEKA